MQKLYSYDLTSGMMYYYSPGYENQTTGLKKDLNKFYVLDIEKQLNKELGELNPKFSALTSTIMLVNIPYLKGVLVEDRLMVYFVSIVENKVYKLTNHKIIDRFKFDVLNTPNKGFIYSEGDYLYFNSSNEARVDSIRLSLSDFELIKDPLYYRTNTFFSNHRWLLFILIVVTIFCIVGILYFLLKWNLKKNSKPILGKSLNIKQDEVYENSNNKDETTSVYFTDFEKLIIKTMLQKADPFNVNEINEILGLKKKTPDFQKKIRTETINRINVKYRQVSGSMEDLIQRVRNNEDKRFVLYMICDREISKLLNL